MSAGVILLGREFGVRWPDGHINIASEELSRARAERMGLQLVTRAVGSWSDVDSKS